MKKISVFLISVLTLGYAHASENTNLGVNNSDSNQEYSITESKSICNIGLLTAANERPYSFYLGYTGNFKNSSRTREKNNDYNHVVEVGFGYTKGLSDNFRYNLYTGADVMFNSHRIWFGPKVGGNLNYSLAMLGSEIIGYTDFQFMRAYWRPYVGVGVGPMKVTFGYNVGLANKATFKEINSFTLGVTIPVFWGGN